MVDTLSLNHLPETADWPDQIPRLEDGWWPTGGAVDPANDSGLMNWQAQLLAQRTGFLREALAAYTALDGATVGAGKTVWSSDGFLMVNTTSNDITITGRDKVTLESNGLVEFFSWFKKKIIGTAAPAGAIMAFAMSDPPEGWLECNGALISKALYPDLYAAIGVWFGGYDGGAGFRVPDLRGQFLRGWDHGRGVDGGRGFGSAQSHAVEKHNHYLLTSTGGLLSGTAALRDDADIWAYDSGVNYAPKVGYYATTSDIGGTANNFSGGNWADETRPRNVALIFCIKY